MGSETFNKLITLGQEEKAVIDFLAKLNGMPATQVIRYIIRDYNWLIQQKFEGRLKKINLRLYDAPLTKTQIPSTLGSSFYVSKKNVPNSGINYKSEIHQPSNYPSKNRRYGGKDDDGTGDFASSVPLNHRGFPQEVVDKLDQFALDDEILVHRFVAKYKFNPVEQLEVLLKKHWGDLERIAETAQDKDKPANYFNSSVYRSADRPDFQFNKNLQGLVKCLESLKDNELWSIGKNGFVKEVVED